MELIHTGIEIKEVGNEGAFEGVASMYGNVDLGGDVVMPGSFKEFYYTPDKKIRILDGHQTRAPIGKGEVVDSHMGLVMRGQLNLKVGRARDVHELMKDGIINGLSIGFDVLPGGSKVRADNVRELHAMKLWEVSTTAFPMNPLTQISAVKSLSLITNIREYENLLRDVLGCSKEQAKILARSYKDLPGQRDVDGTAEDEYGKILSTLNKYA